ncbi:CocE/NonD family hydrolase [Hydrogenophaga laconesensis]|uniref:Acyl esterase n=1 Tax=Hydrogenophaga laconesensis TaxID=1805971 RepID=A0ABU1VBC6_9BURK|nr:CocE/NonD family hydrolase [Hydrogenophaga laconesensis]MDR7094613.1 putative acyl esterase [Hydrogenophaga laconesensis]
MKMLRSEIADGMRIDWDVEIVMDDGLVLRADVFRPVEEGQYPVILSHGPYAKGLAFQEGYPDCWDRMVSNHPDVAAGSTNKYQSWEVVDPEKWVAHGYVCVRVDSRGAGRSPGYLDVWSPRETRDFHDCIEWAGTQPWSNGKVGLNGISYYAMNQWQVAALKPPHLSAICAWEGGADFYRDMSYHGGILSTFLANWYDKQVKTVQHGLGANGPRSRVTGEWVCGDETHTVERLRESRADFGAEIRAHPFDDEYWQARTPRWEDIEVPLLSCANWGGQGIHPRGNFEAFTQARSRNKWLEVHGLEHWSLFYTDYGIDLQMRFFDRFLKGQKHRWDDKPRVLLQVRKLNGFFHRHENEWPLARTHWTHMFLDADTDSLEESPGGNSTKSFEALGKGVTFLSRPMVEETEITGPLVAKLHVSSTTEDADLFAVFQIIDPQGKEVVFQGALDPHTPAGQGWLRLSHREKDANRSLPWRPFYRHQRAKFVAPGEVVAVDVEIWPTCVVVPAGHRIALTVRGRDYEWDGPPARLANMKNPLTGCGPFLHNDTENRPAPLYAGTTSIHCGSSTPSSLLLPIVPAR